jgi:hypothetical protein
LRPLYDTVDHLLDLHSMTDDSPPLGLAGTREKGLELARGVGLPEHVIRDAGHAAGKRLRDYAFFDRDDDARSALLVECGQHWSPDSPRLALQSTLRFLDWFGMLPPELARRHLDRAPLPPQQVIEVTEAVTIRSESFRFALPVHGLATVARAGTLIASDGGEEIRAPYDHCVLIMPHMKPTRRVGETAVRLGRRVA